MNVRVFVLSLLLCALWPGVSGAVPRALKGRVVMEGNHGEITGASGVTVILLATGDQTRTDSQGMFRLHLSEQFLAG